LPSVILLSSQLLTGATRRACCTGAGRAAGTAASFCAGESGANAGSKPKPSRDSTAAQAVPSRGLLHRGGPLAWGASLIDEIGRLGLLLLAWFRVAGDARKPLAPAQVACRQAERALQDEEAERRTVAITATGAANRWRTDLAHAAGDRGDIGGNGGRAGSAWRGEARTAAGADALAIRNTPLALKVTLG